MNTIINRAGRIAFIVVAFGLVAVAAVALVGAFNLLIIELAK